MPPRHLRWLLETLDPPKWRGLNDDTRADLKALLARERAKLDREKGQE